MMKKNGFSLIEFVMVIALLGIILVVVTKMYTQALITSQREQGAADAIWQGQISLQRMVRNIRQIRSAADISTMTATNLVFTDMSGTSNNYALSGSTLTRNGNALADGVSSLNFTYYTKTGASGATAANVSYIRINLTITQHSSNYTIATTAYLRDLPS